MPQDQSILSPINPLPLELNTIPQNINQETKKRKPAPTCRKKPGDLSKKTLKAIELCAASDVDPKVALTILNNGKPPESRTVTRVKNNIEKYRLTHPRMVKLARNVVLNTLKGESREILQKKMSKNGEVVEFTEQISPTVSNQLDAAKMVYDRAEPTVHQNVNLNLNAELSPVDLEKYKNIGLK